MRILIYTALALGLLVLVVWLGVKDALSPTERSHVENPVYAVGEAVGPDTDLASSKIIMFGPAFWGQYPGGRVFSTIDAAERYLLENNKAIDGWAIYELSGDFRLDTHLENGVPHLNKSLLVRRLVKKPAIFKTEKDRHPPSFPDAGNPEAP